MDHVTSSSCSYPQDKAFVDRRKKTLSNKLRRFINDHWLLPVFILYLELFIIISSPYNSVGNLRKWNLALLRGPIVMYKIITTDFPHVLVGHFKEISIVKRYEFNIDQVPSKDIARAMGHKESIRRIYERIIQSQHIRNTEIGGVATLIYGPQGPEIRLYEIESMNKRLSDKFHRMSPDNINAFIQLLKDEDTRAITERVGIDEGMIKNLMELLTSDKISLKDKKKLINNFISTYDVYSEYKYILSPYDFKDFLGSTHMKGKYIGLFHFHNNYMEPPSDIDVQNSYMDRQLVFTLGKHGIIIYDVIKGKEIIYTGYLFGPEKDAFRANYSTS